MKGYLARTFPLLCLLGLAAGLRFYRLSGQSLWADEGNSVALIRHSLAEIVRRTAFDIHPPFYYWLLKFWIFLFGDSEIGLRSLSALLGVGLVYLIWLLGSHLFGGRVGMIATALAAFSPLQVYYAQEARMYILLAFLGSLTLWLTLLLLDEGQPRPGWLGFSYILTATAGLYTHYAYPLILLIANLTALGIFIHRRQLTLPIPRRVIIWLGLQLIPLFLYLPWLPVAWRQLTTWPSEAASPSWLTMLETIASTLFFGLSWPYGGALIAVAVLLLLLPVTFGLNASRPALLLLWLWLLLPVLLTLAIYSPAFLKFLLIASPPLMLLLALGLDRLITRLRPKWSGTLLAGVLLLLLLSLSGLSLFHYYTNPTYARDDYRSLVQFIKAVSETGDAVILNAEGQQDVFDYYTQDYHLETPVYPLPRRRPLDKEATLAELEEIAATAGEVYTVYWATQQADPEGLIEDWLNSHLFKATDQWYGNVRLVSYAVPQARPEALSLLPLQAQLGPNIRLLEYAVGETYIKPGDILQVALRWQTEAPLAQNYVVFLQVLDAANHVVGQRDAQPLLPTSSWPPDKPVSDVHGVFIEPGTPPGPHRLIVGLYDQASGQRLPVMREDINSGDFVELSGIEIVPPTPLLPPTAFTFQYPVNVSLGGVTLLGYDLSPLGQRASSEMALSSNTPVQLIVYWQLNPSGPPVTDQIFIESITPQGEKRSILTTQPLAGVDYPVGRWQVGEIVRAQYVFFLSDLLPGTYRLALTVDGQSVMTRPFQLSGS